MRTIEDVATKNGIKSVREINKEMGELIEAQTMLSKYVNGICPENPGLRGILSRRAGDTATIAGEAVGQSFGVPGAGAVIGRGVAGWMAKPGMGSIPDFKIPAKATKAPKPTPKKVLQELPKVEPVSSPKSITERLQSNPQGGYIKNPTVRKENKRNTKSKSTRNGYKG